MHFWMRISILVLYFLFRMHFQDYRAAFSIFDNFHSFYLFVLRLLCNLLLLRRASLMCSCSTAEFPLSADAS